MLNKLEQAHPDLELRGDGKGSLSSVLPRAKKAINKSNTILILGFALSLAVMRQAAAQGTSFTCQGRLSDDDERQMLANSFRQMNRENMNLNTRTKL